MALPNFVVQDATTYKTAIDDTAQDHENRIEAVETSFPNVDGAVSASDEDLSEMEGMAAAFPDGFYAETTVELGRMFDAGMQVKCVRIGSIVTISGSGVGYGLSHRLASTAYSDDGIIPAGFRPSDATENLYFMDTGAICGISVSVSGMLYLHYMDWTGSAVTRTTSVVVPSITYVIT